MTTTPAPQSVCPGLRIRVSPGAVRLRDGAGVTISNHVPHNAAGRPDGAVSAPHTPSADASTSQRCMPTWGLPR
jgi:hypothetical protein